MIGVLDYGVGNVQALLAAFKALSLPARRLVKQEDTDRVSHLVLPGVGNYGRATALFSKFALRDWVESSVMEKKMPILGICVGYQMMGVTSEESPGRGLGWLNIEVKKISPQSDDLLPVPHTGWNVVDAPDHSLLFDGLLAEEFYFLHSYAPVLGSDKYVTHATVEYGGPVVVASEDKNVFGVQFHPEKSHRAGLALLHNFQRHT